MSWPLGSVANAWTLCRPLPIGTHELPSQRLALYTRPPIMYTPPATRSPFGNTANARTGFAMPAPIGTQDVPFHRATPELEVPACLKEPPATSWPFHTTNALTRLSRPVASGSQSVPVHRATRSTACEPASSNEPDATT